jgi:hypothetical protein
MGDELFAPSEYLESLGALRVLMEGRLPAAAPTGPDAEVLQRAIRVLDRELELRDLLGYMRNVLHRV